MSSEPMISDARRAPQRVRHDNARQSIAVAQIQEISPLMRRIVFQAETLRRFVSLSPDDHVKLLLETADGEPHLRDYTPRYFNADTGELAIDFALHDAGFATNWAMQAKLGDVITIAGPRGSIIAPPDFDWLLLVGDETALPSIGRRLEETKRDAKVIAIVLVENTQEEQAIDAPSSAQIMWVHRQGRSDAEAVDLLAAQLSASYPQTGEGYIWIAGEASMARRLRAHCSTVLGHPMDWMRAAGYWVKGRAGEVDRFDS